jgi:hypothetical protein
VKGDAFRDDADIPVKEIFATRNGEGGVSGYVIGMA